jgi:drug/metabolite transporter (DMT)-like permease
MALVSALSWGSADFIGGLTSRRFAVPIVLLGAGAGGMLFSGALLLTTQQSVPPADDLWLGALAGFISIFALAAFYRALAIGTMSIVAPISATGSSIPVVVGIADGDEISLLAAIGLVLTVGGVMLASREQDAAETGSDAAVNHRDSILLAVCAAIGFGTIFVLIERASAESLIWPSFAIKVTSFAIVAIALLFSYKRVPKPWPQGTQWGPFAVVGSLDVAANITFAYASTHGPLSITAVVASMFPVTTVLLAYRFLGERIATVQKIGVVSALIGLVLLATV